MPAEFKLRMSQGLPITPDQRDVLFSMICADLSALVAANPDSVIVAGLVVVSERHRRMLLSVSDGALFISLAAPLDVLVSRAARRLHAESSSVGDAESRDGSTSATADGRHFFNPAALTALHSRLEPVEVAHVAVDASQEADAVFEEVLRHISERQLRPL